VVEVINNPRSRMTIGASSFFLRLAYQLFPALTRNITASVIRTYLKHAAPMQRDSGNILHQVAYGTSVEGGWRKPVSKSINTKAGLLAAGIAGVIIGSLLIGRK
jgi:hypothetical protein